MNQTSSNRSHPARARDIELLENRQLFAGYAHAGPGYFPGLQPFAQFIEIDRGISINFVIPGFQGGYGGPANQASNNNSSSNSSSSSSTARVQSADATTSQNVAAAPHVTLATADDVAPNQSNATPAIALVRSDDAPAARANSATPAPIPAVKVDTIATPQKLFSDRPVTAAVAAPAAQSSSGLLNLLASATQTDAKTWQPESAARSHRANGTAQADESVKQQSLHREQTPVAATLATLPTGGLMNQPLWQRIAAASATIIILSVNWILRRKREKATIARPRS